MPKYDDTWDVGLVFRWIRSLGPNRSLTRKMLLYKFVCLVKLDCMSRASDLARCFRHRVSISAGKLLLSFYQPKEWRPGGKYISGKYSSLVTIHRYLPDPLLCTVTTAKFFLAASSDPELFPDDLLVEGRRTRGLFPSVVRKKGVYFSLSRDRLNSLLLEAFSLAGVPAKFGAHSTRSAAMSMAVLAGASADTVLAQARMSSLEVFRKFYHRPVVGGVRAPRKVRKAASMAYFIRASV
jgi:hypothetical protein